MGKQNKKENRDPALLDGTSPEDQPPATLNMIKY